MGRKIIRNLRGTIYALNIYGQVFRDEVALISHGRGSNDAPFVRFTEPPRRTVNSLERDHWKSRYLLILAGHGHLAPIPVGRAGETNARRDPGILGPWDDLLDAYIREHGVEVIADYRDIIRPEILATYRAVQAEEDRKLEIFREEMEARRRPIVHEETPR